MNFYRFLLQLAWKYVYRNKGRSFFIIFSVSLSVFFSIVILAFFNGMFSQIEESVVNTNTGYYQLQEDHFAESSDANFPLAMHEDLQKKLLQSPIKSYSPELVAEANINQPEGSAALQMIGVTPTLHLQTFGIGQHMVSGQFLKDESEGVVIGEELATEMNFNVGDNLLINFQDQAGEIRSENIVIEGVYRANSKAFQRKYIYLTQFMWQKLYLKAPTNEMLFNRIAVNTNGLQDPQRLNFLSGKNLVLKSWKSINPEMGVVLDFNAGMLKFFLVIIGITVTMTILNPVRMLWEERLKEFKMLSILGISRKFIWRLGFLEAGIVTAISLALTLTALVIVIGIQSRTGVDFSFLNQGQTIERAGIVIPTIIYPRLTWGHAAFTLIFVTLTVGFGYAWSIALTLKKLKVVA